MYSYCTVKVSKTEEQQVVNQWMRPHFWFLVYGEPSTCNTTTPTSNAVLEYRMEFLNPDSSGVANDHFGDDYRGELYYNYCWYMSSPWHPLDNFSCLELLISDCLCYCRPPAILCCTGPSVHCWDWPVCSSSMAHHQQGRSHARGECCVSPHHIAVRWLHLFY